MAEGRIKDSELAAIAAAIRSKNGGSTVYKPGDMAQAILDIPTGGSAVIESKSITQNGTYTAPTGVDGYSPITVDVPNSYSQSDEGKVVSNGALVAQGSDTVTQNGIVDTTLIKSLTVNVSGGGSLPSGLHISTSAPTSGDGTDGDTWWKYNNVDAGLKGSSNGYLITNYQLAPAGGMEVTFYVADYNSGGYEMLCGVATNWSGDRGTYYMGFNNRSDLAFNFCLSPSSSNLYHTSGLKKTDCIWAPHTAKIINSTCYIDGVLNHTFSGTPDSTPIGLVHIFNVNGTDSYFANGIVITNCKLWDADGTLARDYTPYNNNGTLTFKDSITGHICSVSGTALIDMPARYHVMTQYSKSVGAWTDFG